MNFLNADVGTMATTVKKLNAGKPPLYTELKIRCELLEAQAVIHDKVVGDMSKEICDLNNQIQNMLDELKEMQ